MNIQQEKGDLLLPLEQELEQMAREVPEMPEDFRAGWRQAIRAESPCAEAEATRPSQEHTGALPPRRAGVSRKWLSLLSVAAAVVFLIAGTLATRGMLSPRLKQQRVTATPVPTSLSGEAPDAGKAATAEEEAAEEVITLQAEERVEGTADAYMSLTGSSMKEETAGDSAEAYRSLEESGAADAYMSQEESRAADAYMSREESRAADASFGEYVANGDAMGVHAGNGFFLPSAGTESELSGETGLTDAAAAPDATSHAMPDATVCAVTDTAATGAREQEAPGFWREVGFFLEDMGAFLLAALPSLAGIAALSACVLLLLRRFRRRG